MNKKASGNRFLSRRKKAVLWSLLVAAILWLLLYFEQIAAIYILSTLGLILLLLIVSFSDLERVGLIEEEPDTAGKSVSSQSPSQSEAIEKSAPVSSVNDQNQSI